MASEVLVTGVPSSAGFRDTLRRFEEKGIDYRVTRAVDGLDRGYQTVVVQAGAAVWTGFRPELIDALAHPSVEEDGHRYSGTAPQ
ncbi:NrdH-redoxin [Clavibacter sp. VKM Ac-2872]|uniref:NrdH-redoxin n=1 Tax=Clavibacter sp. VKM Ac-2872 TaxID=2783812 RepID=UPI00188A589B|nr:NrdH-redoxin [Clavibacter sp. VKM Ac-2872]MBF4625825.1 NrdH-redoxin [Clavibacter sp. VKM Ac-2872]